MSTVFPVAFSNRYSNRPTLLEALDSNPPTSVRINPFKNFDCQWGDPVSWCDYGRYLPQRPVFTLDPIFAAGGYYVQEASSMFVGWLFERLNNPADVTVLDLCAAPGGKTTHLQSLVGRGGVVVANEVIRNRAGVLAQNSIKWGVGNCVVTSADAAAFGDAMGGYFDVIVADVPCSGEGMFRKQISARSEWNEANVALCASRARRIISDAWGALRDGGVLIFSTCTFNRTENEDNVNWICEELGGEILTFGNTPQGVELTGGGYRFYPDIIQGEGFFATAIRKSGSDTRGDLAKVKRGKNGLGKSGLGRNKNDLGINGGEKLSSEFTNSPLILAPINDTIYGYTPIVAQTVANLRAARIPMLTSGVEIGQLMHGKLKPQHALALYYDIKTDLFPRTEVELDIAGAFLRKDNIAADLLHDGLQLITYGGLPIGFAKRIGGRVNNLYPTSWRTLI